MTFAVSTGPGTWTLSQPSSSGEVKLTDGTLVIPGSQGWTTALAALCGYIEVQGTPPVNPPADGFKYVRSLEDVAGVPMFVWTETAKTQEELDAEAAAAADQAEQDAAKAKYQALINYSEVVGPNVTQITTATQEMAVILAYILKDLYGPPEAP